MSTAQELFALLRNAKPGPNYQKPQPAAPKPEPVTSLFAKQMPEWPHASGEWGDAYVVSVFRERRYALGDLSRRETNLAARVDCKVCEQPRLQQLVGRTFAGGETWSALPCDRCPLDLGGVP